MCQVCYLLGISQFLKQNDQVEIKDHKWYSNENCIYWKVKGYNFKICNHLVSNMNQKCQEKS